VPPTPLQNPHPAIKEESIFRNCGRCVLLFLSLVVLISFVSLDYFRPIQAQSPTQRKEVFTDITEEAGINPGQTTADGMFTLMEVECLGACDRAPVVMINDDHWHERLAPEQVGEFLDGLRARGVQSLTGCHLCVESRK